MKQIRKENDYCIVCRQDKKIAPKGKCYINGELLKNKHQYKSYE